MISRLLAMIALFGSVVSAWAQNVEVGRVDRRGERAVLVVESPRPVDSAALTLAKEFGIAINVEDPLSGVSGRMKLEIPFALDADGRPRDLAGLVRDLVVAANARLPFVYRIDTEGGRFTLVAVDPKGTSLLDRRVTIPAGTRSIAANATLMADALAAQTGIRVHCCQSASTGIPWGMEEIAFAVENEPARNVLRRLVEAAGQGSGNRMFWLQRCDPRTGGWCFINLFYANQPTGVALRISAPKARFYLGDLIPLTLSFAANQLGTYVADSRLQDRVGRMNFIEEFRVEPVAATEDPLRGLPGEIGGMGGLSGGNILLIADKPFHVERNLNEWVRFRKPGTYRLSVVSRRVRQATGIGKTSGELQQFGNSKPVEVASNMLTLEILAAPPEWVAEQITAATALLDRPVGNDGENVRQRQNAGLTLRFLNTLESGTALAKRLPNGILDSTHREELLPVLERLLVAPGQAVSENFLNTLAQLAVLVTSGGVMGPYPQSESARQEWQKESKRRADLLIEKREYFVSLLVQNLPTKTPEARAMTNDALLGVAEAFAVQPTWLKEIVNSLIADFRALPARMQSSLLDSRFRFLRRANILPLLEDLARNPPEPPLGYPSIYGSVLKRIYELRPERGRALILEELRRSEGSRVESQTLMMLPDENLPELDAVLAAQVARGGPLPAQMILRYATGAIVKPVEAAYLAFSRELDRQKLPHCPFPLVFYFLKFDPEFGERELRKAFATGPCYDMGSAFESLGPYAMSPALERMAIEHLTSGIVAVKRGAAAVLGRSGSPKSQQPLWETMEYFRSWWKEREGDLRTPAGFEGILLERTLRTALAKAGGWVLGEAELRRLLELCSSAECRAGVAEWLRNAKAPVRIDNYTHLDQIAFNVAQYSVSGEDGLRMKLAQFPAGTTFRVAEARSEEAKLTRTRVEAAVREADHRLVQ